MSSLVKRFERNTHGRDFIVGDIHGCFSKLEKELTAIGFNSNAGDRLFSVGDLIDRGPESDLVLDWLDFPWFHAVQGNHEDMAIRWPKGNMDPGNYAANGGAWNIMNTPDQQVLISDALSSLPISIEIETSHGTVGIVHADCPLRTWTMFIDALESSDVSKSSRQSVIDAAMWSRNRIETKNATGVDGVRAVVVGHTPIKQPIALGNVLYIDTGGWLPVHRGIGHFTILNAETLQPAKGVK